jgi:hypothetical protein
MQVHLFCQAILAYVGSKSIISEGVSQRITAFREATSFLVVFHHSLGRFPDNALYA